MLQTAIDGASSGDDVFLVADQGDYRLGGGINTGTGIRLHGLNGRPRLIFADGGLRTGKTVSVLVKLTTKALALLKPGKALKTTASAVARDAAGTAKTSAASVARPSDGKPDAGVSAATAVRWRFHAGE